MAGDAPSVFQVQYAAPSLPAAPGSTRRLPVIEPCSALSDYVSTPAGPDAPGCLTCAHNITALSRTYCLNCT